MWSKEKRNVERIDTLIASDVIIKGDISFKGGIQIDGCVKGTIRGDDELSVVRITRNGRVEGDIKAPVIIVNGRVSGSVYASGRLELGANSHVIGDVHYQLMEMVMGAEINGKMMHETLGVQSIDPEKAHQAAEALGLELNPSSESAQAKGL